VFLSVVREGVESVIFLGATRFGTGAGSLWGALAGLAAASLLGFLLFRGAVRVRLGLFFTVTNLLLLLFAAGLVAHGLHELVEAGWLPALVDPVWDLNPLLPEQGLAGQSCCGAFSATMGIPPAGAAGLRSCTRLSRRPCGAACARKRRTPV